MPGRPSRFPRALRSSALAALWLAAAACGAPVDDAGEGAAVAPWSFATVEGLATVGGLAVHGTDLVLVERERVTAWHAVRRADLRDGAVVPARALPLLVNPDSPVAGRDRLAARGLGIRDLASVRADLVGLGVADAGSAYVADRRLRVVWWARLHAAPGGGLGSVTLDQAIVLPGGDRRGLDAADPSDHGPGLRALAVLPSSPLAFDLAVLDAQGPSADVWRLHRLDRTGAVVKSALHVTRAAGGAPDVVALAFEGGRFLALAAGAHLVPFVEQGDRPLALGSGTPLPSPGGWERLAVGPEGTHWLAAATPAGIRVAWRAP